MGLNYRTAQKWFQRGNVPDTDSLVKIAAHFRVDLNWLVRGESPASPLLAHAVKKLKLFRKRKGWSLEELGEKMSPQKLEAAVLELFEKGAAAPSLDFFQEAARILGVSFHEFWREEEPPAGPQPELKVFQTYGSKSLPIRDEDYVTVPLTRSAIAAGQPILAENQIEDYVLLHVRAAGQRHNLVASRVDGDSMEPMLHSGDIVVIDRDDKRVLKNKMYAIFYEDGLTAKYVERQKDLLILRPINPNSQVQVVNLAECPDPVVGRIIGAWKEL
ncbi:MAG: LexA family transcriptional regulator [Nitrospinae bacterium]|nr:LexA family transcriptional regulator [Nitrospinota bacterium]